MGDEILFKEQMNIDTHRGLRNGYIILTKDRFYMFIRDKKPYIETSIDRDDLAVYKTGALNDAKYKIIISETAFAILPSMSATIHEMTELGFIE